MKMALNYGIKMAIQNFGDSHALNFHQFISFSMAGSISPATGMGPIYLALENIF
jgi:hypothetical protein